VFRAQGVLTGDEQVAASELFGGQQIHSTHGVHPQAPNRHVFRLSNRQEDGILGVGPQWHNDGSFERAVFSHVGYHIIKVPEHGGATTFSHQGAAFDALSLEEQETWQRRVSVNSNSGAVHPLVHSHPISGRKSVYLHLGMTGAVLEMAPGVKQVDSLAQLRLLEEDEMVVLFNRYNRLLDDDRHRVNHSYEEGDCIFIDNLAIAHRASPEAHQPPEQRGLRILHRTTVAGMANFDPPPQFQLPPVIDVYGANPFGKGVFIGGGLGFRWDPAIHMQN
jgi:taurine dioxygenase